MYPHDGVCLATVECPKPIRAPNQVRFVETDPQCQVTFAHGRRKKKRNSRVVRIRAAKSSTQMVSTELAPSSETILCSSLLIVSYRDELQYLSSHCLFEHAVDRHLARTLVYEVPRAIATVMS